MGLLDTRASRSKARADVAELYVTLAEEIQTEKKEDTHVINIAVKRALSVTEFKQMFYARGDDDFCIANGYECPDNPDSILASVWGKRMDNNPYNPHSRVINFNRLGGRPNKPNGVDMAYGYAMDLQRTFFAQFEIMGNWERDLCVKRQEWSLCSRQKIEDQLYGLAFVPETSDDLCLKVLCARQWSEVEKSLVESCLAEGKVLTACDHVDLFINVKVMNSNLNTKPTVIRIRFTVQLTRGPDDLGDWNIRSRDAAASVIQHGIQKDTPQGGYRQEKDSSNIKKPPYGHPPPYPPYGAPYGAPYGHGYGPPHYPPTNYRIHGPGHPPGYPTPSTPSCYGSYPPYPNGKYPPKS